MQRFLMASVLGLIAACGASAGQQPARKAVAVTTVNDGDVVCGNEVSAAGTTHRVCHKLLPSSAETGEEDMVCTDETPTGTLMTRRVCRSHVEQENDKRLARELYLMQAARPVCDPEQTGRRCDGQPDLRPR